MMQQCSMCFVYRGNRHHQDDETVYIAPDLLPDRKAVQGEIEALWTLMHQRKKSPSTIPCCTTD